MTKARTEPDTFASVCAALADTPEEAANLQARAFLIQQLAAIVAAQWMDAGKRPRRCGVTQPRINDLLQGASRAFRSTRSSTSRPRSVGASTSNCSG